jgi:hypothetical protein
VSDEPKKKGRGGSRKHPGDCQCGKCPTMGPKKRKPEALADGDKNFATRVLARIGKPGWRDFVDITKVQDDEDYALHLLLTVSGYDQFNKLLDRKLGKPVQTVNHLHDKPIQHEVTLSMAEIVRKVRQRKQEYERSRS